MKRFNIMTWVFFAVWTSGFAFSSAAADIYFWTDENGVKYFTNYAPPKQAKILMKTPEIPYDETADDQRREIDRLEIARQELADREARLLQQQLEAERRIAEANSRAEETLRRADKILEEAEAAAENTDYDSSGRYASGYYPYYPYGYGPGYYSSGYYRKHGGIYYKKRHFNRRPYQKYFSTHPQKHRFRGKTSIHHRSRFQGRRLSHRSRVTLFRGRHGRF